MLSLIGAITVLLAGVAQQPDPLAPARQGKVLCYGPELADKVCEGVSRFVFHPDGRITNVSVSLLGAYPSIVARTSLEVYVREGADCSMITNTADMFTAISVEDEPLEGAAFEEARDEIAGALEANLGTGEYCTSYQSGGDGTLETITSVNGVKKPSTRNHAIWISADDGWRVAPRPS